MKRQWITEIGITPLVLGLTLWAYWGVRQNPFNFDDALFLQSPEVTVAPTPWELLRLSQSRQLAYLTFYWNYRLAGSAPAAYHLANLFVHCLNVIAMALLMRLLLCLAPETSPPSIHVWLPSAAAGVFALHPIQSEAVLHIYQRSTLLAALFAMLTLILFLCSFIIRPRLRWIPLVPMLICLAAACLSKEVALVLPFTMGAILWVHPSLCTGNPGKRPQVLVAVLGLLALSAAAWMLYRLNLAGERTVGLALAKESFRYLSSQVQVFAAYLGLLLWPGRLAVDHDFMPASMLSIRALFCWLLIVSLIVLF